MENHNKEQNIEGFKGNLSALDDKLECFAKKYHTSLTSPDLKYFVDKNDTASEFRSSNSLKNRQIEWIDGDIAKAVVIQPHLSSPGHKSDAWDFFILAWLYNAPSFEKPFWQQCLLKNASIQTLERNIDQLLSQSEDKLSKIKVEDFKNNW